MAHRCPTSGAVYYVNLQTLATTWTSPVPTKPPEDVPCATCMECPCACAARADEAQSEAQAKALEAVKAHTAVPQKYRVAEEVPVDQSRRGHVMGVCVAYNRGYCRRGDDCRYEHAFTKEAREVAAATTFVDVREIPAAQLGKQKKQPCFDLKHKGFCTRGAACPFAHTGHEGLPATRRQRKAQRSAEAQEPAAPAESVPPVRAVTAPAPARHPSAERPRSPVSDDDDVVPQRERAPLPERHARRLSDDDDRPRRDYSRERPSPRRNRSRKWRRDRSPDRWRITYPVDGICYTALCK